MAILLASAVATDCGYVRVPIAAGGVVSERDVLRDACTADDVPAKLRFDARRGVAVARQALARREALGQVYLPERPEVMPGDRIAIVSRRGHIAVATETTAMQRARRGERFFVRDAEGQVWRAPRLSSAVQR